MATTTQSMPSQYREAPQRGRLSKRFNWEYFLQDNLTGSRWLTIWVLFLAAVTLVVTVGQLLSSPARAQVIVAVWGISVLSVVVGELFTLHTPVSRWLQENMLGTITNALTTLLLALLIGQVADSLWNWGYVNATFDPALTAPDVRSEGASWGVIWGAR